MARMSYAVSTNTPASRNAGIPSLGAFNPLLHFRYPQQTYLAVLESCDTGHNGRVTMS